jgi:hypothetical protein
VDAGCQPPPRGFFWRRYHSSSSPVHTPSTATGPQLKCRKKEGGRVPRQGRHVLDGTLDRMEGASLRGPETLPPWNLVFKWSDTLVGITHWGPEVFPPCTLMMVLRQPPYNPSSGGISRLNRNDSCKSGYSPTVTKRQHGVRRSSRRGPATSEAPPGRLCAPAREFSQRAPPACRLRVPAPSFE